MREDEAKKVAFERSLKIPVRRDTGRVSWDESTRISFGAPGESAKHEEN